MERNQRLPLESLSKELPDKLDAFICCASFESRCRAVADAIARVPIAKTVVFQNGSIADVIGDNASYLRNRFSDTYLATIDPSDPVASERSLIEALTWLDIPSRTVLVDITTFTRETLLILLRLLRASSTGADVIFAYVGAAKYSVNDEAPEEIWLSHGVRDVRSVLGFPGIIQPSRKTHLILLVGFESQRAITLISAYEPSVLSLGYGPLESSITPQHHRLNVIFHEKVAALYGDVHGFEFPPNDPKETKNAILRQAEQFTNLNVVVAALNTKLSTIGAGLAAFENPTIQLCYAEADVYNFANYSTPGGDCYLFSLPLA